MNYVIKINNVLPSVTGVAMDNIIAAVDDRIDRNVCCFTMNTAPSVDCNQEAWACIVCAGSLAAQNVFKQPVAQPSSGSITNCQFND